MQNNNYGELFCQAIDIIAQERINSVSYDKTILCVIEDASQASKGRYVVKYNSTRFEAFSTDTSYKDGNNVYVQIPQGDWNEQKIIVSKKTDKTNTPITYLYPFDTFVDITENLLLKNPNTQSLLANNTSTNGQEIIIWSYNSPQSQAIQKEAGTELAGYSRLGIRASFQSWLNDFNTITGSYGLKLRIEAIANDENDNDEKDEEELKYYDYFLDSSNMIGNPYNYESFFEQEQLFDISNIYKIKRMELLFYQKPGTFKDPEGNLIPHMHEIEDFGLLDPNLFVKDIYVALGYDTHEFDTDTAVIYSFNSSKYSEFQDPLHDNHKLLNLRWIHKVDDRYVSVKEDDELDYTITWYRKVLGVRSHTPYSGVDWRPLSRQTVVKGKIVESTPADMILDLDWIEYNKIANVGYYRSPSFMKTWLIPNVSWQTEEVKAIITYDNDTKVIYSNILSFTNDHEVSSKATMEAMQALSIRCDDNSYGNYLIYNIGGNIGDYSEASRERTLTAMFKASANEDIEEAGVLTNAESIEWIIPRRNTMIEIDEEFLGADYTPKDPDAPDEYYHIFRYGEKLNGFNITNQNTQRYRIKGFYSQSYCNNTIQCKVVKNTVTYTVSKEFTFGPSGTSGTDYTFILDFDYDVTALTLNSDKVVTVSARLYDYTGREVTGLENYDVIWSWKDDSNLMANGVVNNFIEIVNPDVPAWTKELKLKAGATMQENYHILQATLVDYLGDLDNPFPLTAYLSIPIRASEDYKYMSGPVNILYDSSGQLMDHTQVPYQIHTIDGILGNLKWDIENAVSNEEAYTPTIYQSYGTHNYILQPLNIFVKDCCEYVTIFAKNASNQIVWSQPLIIMQNRYPSAMINKWDGSLKIDEVNNAIMAAKIAAGRKNPEDNTFSGVIMGDWGTDDGSAESQFNGTTGLYGFYHGAMSFGFRDNGTAFIGPDGKGRIEFDGRNATITSSIYLQDGPGVLIDLDGENGKPFLHIRGYSKDNEINDIFHIGDGTTGNYIQSANYVQGDGSEGQGIHLDLNEGKFIAQGEFTFEGGDQLRLSTTSPYFYIYDNHTPGTPGNADCPLIYMADGEYYLQSHDYEDEIDDPRGSGLRIDLYEPEIKARGKFTLEVPNRVRLSTESPYFYVTDDANYGSEYSGSDDEKSHTLIYMGDEGYYLQTSGFTEEANKEKGMRIDLGNKDGENYSISAYGNFTLKAKSDATVTNENGVTPGGTIILSSAPESDPFSIVSHRDSNYYFKADWDGYINATGGRIGGWYFYRGSGQPPEAKSSAAGMWNVIYCKSKRVWDQGNQTVFYGNTVFGADLDNVIAINIPDDKLWVNHNFHDEEGQGASLTITGDGSINARKGRIAGWHLTATSLQNFTGTKPSDKYTILYSGGDTSDSKWAIETTSINISGTNSKLVIGKFTITSSKISAGDNLIISAEGAIQVGGEGGFKVNADGQLICGNFSVAPNGVSTIVTIGGAQLKAGDAGYLNISTGLVTKNIHIDGDLLWIKDSGARIWAGGAMFSQDYLLMLEAACAAWGDVATASKTAKYAVFY